MSDTVRLSVRVDRKDRDLLQSIADSQGLKFSDLIRDSVKNYIASYNTWKLIFNAIHARRGGIDGSQTFKSQFGLPSSDPELN